MRQLSMRIDQKETIINNGLSEDSVLVVGIVKNIENSIKLDISRIEKSLSFFKETSWYLVESGSSDKSKEVLEELTRNKKNFEYISLEDSTKSKLFRTEKMAMARNQYLDFIRKNDISQRYKYVVIADFNLLNSKISQHSILSSWAKSDWGVVTSNQSGPYYDIWALRHKYWSPNDCWGHHAFLMEHLKFPEKAITYAIRARMIKIPKDSDWIQVDSAFGGFAIYKSEVFKNTSFYRGIDKEGNQICEHVPFHEQLRNFGVRIFVNPNMINTNYTDHSRRINGFFRVLRLAQYPIKLVKRSMNNKRVNSK
jgi:hypothetical protein